VVRTGTPVRPVSTAEAPRARTGGATVGIPGGGRVGDASAAAGATECPDTGSTGGGAAAPRAGDGGAAAGNPGGDRVGDAAAPAGARERPGTGGSPADNTGGGAGGGAAGAGSRHGRTGEAAGVGSRRGGVSGASPPARHGYPRPSRGDTGGGAQSRYPPPWPRLYPGRGSSP